VTAGPGVFETVVVEDGRVRLLDRHLERLRRAGVREDLVTSVRSVLDEACLHQTGPAQALRLDLLDCRVAVTPRAPLDPTPVRLVPVAGYDPTDVRREHKAVDRGWADAALAHARAVGADDALLVSPSGLVGETTRANVFAVLADGTTVTPPVAGLLPGVTRSWAIEATAAVERPLTVGELVGARAVFLTTAGRGVVPVRALGASPLPEDPVVARLAAAWQEL
jgi:branched-subunit amino acid aminotransferase/4-amino-4-deoxychorismate lyase